MTLLHSRLAFPNFQLAKNLGEGATAPSPPASYTYAISTQNFIKYRTFQTEVIQTDSAQRNPGFGLKYYNIPILWPRPIQRSMITQIGIMYKHRVMYSEIPLENAQDCYS